MIGPIIRHGPHHGAQQSNRTTPELFRISCAKFWSVTTTGLAGLAGWAVALVRTLPHFPHFAMRPARELASTRFLVPHLPHVTIGIEQNLPLGCRKLSNNVLVAKVLRKQLIIARWLRPIGNTYNCVRRIHQQCQTLTRTSVSLSTIVWRALRWRAHRLTF